MNVDEALKEVEAVIVANNFNPSETEFVRIAIGTVATQIAIYEQFGNDEVDVMLGSIFSNLLSRISKDISVESKARAVHVIDHFVDLYNQEGNNEHSKSH